MDAKQTLPKILLPLDGSELSLGTVRYITKINAFKQMRVVLMHVYAGIPESYYDLKRDPRSTGTVVSVRAWEAQQKKDVQGYMQKAKGILLDAGFPENAVEVKIQKRKQGFARDIIKEARDGYDAVVARRRGVGAVRGLVVGSVANKLLQGLDFLPFMLAGRAPVGKGILLAFDGSPGGMRAVDCVGAFLAGSDFNVCLLHVIRGREKAAAKYQGLFSPQEFVEEAQIDIAARFDEAKATLVHAGFDERRISTKVIVGVQSRAAAIVDEAKKKNFGTIVMGRRGLSQVRSFFIGRVTNKVIHLGRDRSVWVVR
jgi:nucleotide-binding universal stress UspA family protein